MEDLRVQRIQKFNLPLLGKWSWRMHVDESSLWYKVLGAWESERGPEEG